MGRPTKLNKELTTRICEIIKKGNYDYIAALSCGITRKTFYNWRERGKTAKSGIYYEFLHAIRNARADWEAEAVSRVNTVDPKWVLERSCQNRWVKKDEMKIEHSGKISFDQFKDLFKDEE